MMKRKGWIPFLVQIVLVFGPMTVLFGWQGIGQGESLTWILEVIVWLGFIVGFVPMFLHGLSNPQRWLPLVLSILTLLFALIVALSNMIENHPWFHTKG